MPFQSFISVHTIHHYIPGPESLLASPLVLIIQHDSVLVQVILLILMVLQSHDPRNVPHANPFYSNPDAISILIRSTSDIVLENHDHDNNDK